MQTLQIDEQQARKLYKTASPEFRQVLHNTFGATFFSEKITDRVKTYEDVLKMLEIEPWPSAGLTTDELAYRKLKHVAEALNESWTPDWNNSSQQKWRNWFHFDAPGFRFSGAGYGYAASYVGSRLCLIL